MPDPEEVLFPTRKERFEDRRKERHQRKLVDEFFDHATLLAISRLVTQGQFDSLDYPISTGKEGGVFRASSGAGFRAVKVYRIGNAVFRHLPPYAVEELRRESSAKNYSRLIYAWTRREHTILRRLRAGGVRCPDPYGYIRNVLVMDFIGNAEGLPSPPLNEAVVADPTTLYHDLVDQIRRMVIEVKLVHGDLSPYNVLWHEDQPVLIDVAQAIPAEHPAARGLLERDVGNFAKYLMKLGVDTTPESFLAAVGADGVGPKE